MGQETFYTLIARANLFPKVASVRLIITLRTCVSVPSRLPRALWISLRQWSFNSQIYGYNSRTLMSRNLFVRGDRLNAKWEFYQVTNLLLLILFHSTERKSRFQVAEIATWTLDFLFVRHNIVSFFRPCSSRGIKNLGYIRVHITVQFVGCEEKLE
ncbi:hypothetical protein MPTK1_7g07150 [Marchantia polymorpha subsp. ruderalis]|uniref:Uncharacterized protein n=2 Tax=Marchantia polymorpha TaxID=3197 RepID=A0AAF6BWZ9_MARPO|nr:hypothetical protein MARPO_0076s0079 [Marchantia polymorpha]BBN16533.1 hypothetical protein Mp_7g07150 [Marchantia polymorpha subsp. ruderalis]|eukprot:PTQ34845.1 hypothetical protein MARPO_0076s0079 [Marchantia polymorpha]